MNLKSRISRLEGLIPVVDEPPVVTHLDVPPETWAEALMTLFDTFEGHPDEMERTLKHIGFPAEQVCLHRRPAIIKSDPEFEAEMSRAWSCCNKFPFVMWWDDTDESSRELRIYVGNRD